MSPIPGIVASQITGHLGAPYVPSDYESIATYAVTSNQSSITFSSIPSTYKHLQVRAFVKTDFTTYPNDSMLMQFNGVTSSSYYYTQQMYANGTSAGAQNFTTTGLGIAYMAGTNANADKFACAIIDIVDYTSTSKLKSVKALGGWGGGGDGLIVLNSGIWTSTPAAINSIVFKPNDGTNFVANSHFALYGIKG